MRARRTDENLIAIVEIARKAGFLVHVTNGDWDLTVQLGTRHEIWEVKSPKGRPTARQEELREQGWCIRTIRTAEDVLRALERMKL